MTKQKYNKHLILVSTFYGDIAGTLMQGARYQLQQYGGPLNYELVYVPGALELPQALDFKLGADPEFDSCVALGCVIRGETAHFDVVVRNSSHFLMEVALRHKMPLGQGILTVDSRRQALERAYDKGQSAVKAAMALADLKIMPNITAEVA